MHINPLAIAILAYRILLTSSSAFRQMQARSGVEAQVALACSRSWDCGVEGGGCGLPSD